MNYADIGDKSQLAPILACLLAFGWLVLQARANKAQENKKKHSSPSSRAEPHLAFGTDDDELNNEIII